MERLSTETVEALVSLLAVTDVGRTIVVAPLQDKVLTAFTDLIGARPGLRDIL